MTCAHCNSKWPWVSRLAFEFAIDARDNERANAQQLRRELVDMTEKYHALRMAGGNPALPPVAPKSDPVTDASIAMSRGSVVLRRGFGEFVTEQRRAGVSDEEIAAAIYAGIPDDQGVPG